MMQSGASSIVEFENVTKKYGEGDATQLANDNVSFSIDEGEFVVILGQSGAGKSTVLNMLGGMDVPTSGRVTVAGQEVSKMNDRELSMYRAGTIGFIFQFYNLLPSLTALENVSLVKNIVREAGDAEEMLAQVGLAVSPEYQYLKADKDLDVVIKNISVVYLSSKGLDSLPKTELIFTTDRESLIQ